MAAAQLASFPFEVVASKVVAEHLPRADLEQVPGTDQIQGGVSRSQDTHVDDRS